MEKFIKKLPILLLVLTISIIAILSVSKEIQLPEPKSIDIDNITQLIEPRKTWIGSYLSGQHAIRKNDFTKASEFFSESLKIKDSDEEFSSQVLELLIASGQFERAKELAKKVYKTDATASAGLFLYADLMRNKDYTGAIKLLNELPEDAHETVIHQIMLAWAQLGADKADKALSIFEKLETKEYFKILVKFNHALLAEIAGDKQSAYKNYTYLIEEMGGKQAQELPLKIAENAYRFLTKNNYEQEAKKIIAHGGKVSEFADQDAPPQISRAVADALNEIATLLVAEQNFSKAAIFFRLGLYIDDSSAEAKMLLATILAHENDFSSSNAVLDSIPQNSEFYYEAQMFMARNYHELKNEIAARRILDDLQKIPALKF